MAVVEPVRPSSAANGLVIGSGARCVVALGGGGTVGFGRAPGTEVWLNAGTARQANSAPITALRPNPDMSISAGAPRDVFLVESCGVFAARSGLNASAPI